LKVLPAIVYEENLLWMPYLAKHTEGHAWLKVLGRDPETGASAALIKYEAGYTAPAAKSTAYSDSLFIAGELVDGGRRCRNLTYSYRPAGSEIGPIETKQETIKFIITGGKGEKSSETPVLIDNIDSGPWEGHPYLGNVMLSRELRRDEIANCTIAWHVSSQIVHSYDNKSMVHDVAEEVFVVEGKNTDYYGDTESMILWRRGMYLYRPPWMARHGHTFKIELPFKVFVKFHSLDPAKPNREVVGVEPTFTE
jgi:hypothetical protein